MPRRRFTLTSEEIFWAKKMIVTRRLTQAQIAKELGVSQATVSYIKTGRIGQEIPWPKVLWDGKEVPVVDIDERMAHKIAHEYKIVEDTGRPWLEISESQWNSLKPGINRWREDMGQEATENDAELWASHEAMQEEVAAILTSRAKPSTDDDDLAFSAPTEADWDEIAQEKKERQKLSGPANYPKREFEEILRLGKGRRLIEACRGEDGPPALREALQWLCHIHRDPDSWRDEWFERLVMETETKLRNWPEALERIKREQPLYKNTKTIKDAPQLAADNSVELPPRTEAAERKDLEEEFKRLRQPGDKEERRSLLQEDIEKIIRGRTSG